MTTKYAIVRSTINLRGHKFPAGTTIKVWDTGDATSIQPVHLPSALHEAMWYAFPEIHKKNIRMVDEWENSCVELGLY
jgi:hypothetical protein